MPIEPPGTEEAPNCFALNREGNRVVRGTCWRGSSYNEFEDGWKAEKTGFFVWLVESLKRRGN
jgi:hypothetical protein